MKLVTAAQMQEIDRRTIEEHGIPGIRLMEMAGAAVAEDICTHFEPCAVAVLCGKGNNAGDGYIVARLLAEQGWTVEILLAAEPPAGDSDAARAWAAVPSSVQIRTWEQVSGAPGHYLQDFDVLVDALLGTGVKGTPRPPFDAIITAANETRLPIVAVDIPSGLDPDTGEAEIAIRAVRTLTMGLPKTGMTSATGRACCGSLAVRGLAFPAELLAAPDSHREILTDEDAAALLPQRPFDGHKGTFGLLTVAAGSEFMPGAAVLTAIGAVRGGCGLVRMHVPPAVRGNIAAHLPEVLISGVRSTAEGELGPIGELAWHLILDRATAMAIGPGVGKGESARQFLAEFFQFCHLPAVLDADVLNLIAEDAELAGKVSARHVLTPHPGELARLLGTDIATVQADRWAAAEEAVSRLRCTVVLKGMGTLIAAPDGAICHCGSGNTALARGGAGDLLTGLLGSLLAQGLDPVPAARLAVHLHGMAAELSTEDRSPRGVRIDDVGASLPIAFRELEKVAAQIGGGRS